MDQSLEKKSSETTSIVIDLRESSDATVFNENDNNFIHYREFRRVKEMISRKLDFLNRDEVDKKQGAKFVKERYHDTITVFGTRGSGKTSFLLNLLENLDSNKEIAVLPIIDPTLIEEKGHVFLNVISLIEQKVTEKLDADSMKPDNKDYLDSARWRRMVEQLAHGLPSIDGIGGSMTDTQWQDPEFIMDNGIRSVISARELESNFNKLVEEGLKIIGKKAFLIVFDDIDIDFRKGWQVLETIRKYLTSPRVITVLSGDFRLLSLAIKKHQWENLGDKFKESELVKNNKLHYYNELVTEMESQYLQKVLKPERRIHLSTLKEKLQLLGDNKYGIFVDTQSQKLEITEFYKKILGGYGVSNAYQAETYSSFLLSLPLRTQIRFLCLFERLETALSAARITDIFLSELYEKQVDVNLLNSLPKYLNSEILKLLLTEHVLAEAYQLQPITTDDSLNSCLVALSFSFAQSVLNKQPHLIFDYFIRIGYTRNLVNSLGYEPNAKSTSYLNPSVEGLCKYAEIQGDKVLRDVTGLMNAYVIAFSKSSHNLSGMLPLQGLAESGKISREDGLKRIDRVFQQDNRAEILGHLPVGVYKYPTKQKAEVMYSVYMLLGTIGELIRKSAEKDVRRGLLELSQIRTYPMPDFERKASDRVEHEEGGEEEDEVSFDQTQVGGNDAISELVEIFEGWVNKFPGSSYSPHLLGKIATRTFYASEAILAKRRTNQSKKLGAAMHYQIIAFLNAVLVEDAKENMAGVGKLNINNTNFSDRIFINNVLSLVENGNSLTLSKWILSCPLLLCYLNITDDIKEALVSFCNGIIDERSFGLSIYSTLLNVDIRPKSGKK